LTVLCGFSRRFDASYRDDDYFVRYARFSGGIFVDATVHDVDLALWYLGPDSVVKSVTAVGVTARLAGLEAYGDVENGVGVVEFWGGGDSRIFIRPASWPPARWIRRRLSARGARLW
jgi:myo-inositol 2-dehydrogenase/D-chiro-inositol 1-dehydrogenase